MSVVGTAREALAEVEAAVEAAEAWRDEYEAIYDDDAPAADMIHVTHGRGLLYEAGEAWSSLDETKVEDVRYGLRWAKRWEGYDVLQQYDELTERVAALDGFARDYFGTPLDELEEPGFRADPDEAAR